MHKSLMRLRENNRRINEKRVRKEVIRDGKRTVEYVDDNAKTCPEGYKLQDGKCVKMGLKERRDRSIAAKKGANTLSAKRNKRNSMNRRDALIQSTESNKAASVKGMKLSELLESKDSLVAIEEGAATVYYWTTAKPKSGSTKQYYSDDYQAKLHEPDEEGNVIKTSYEIGRENYKLANPDAREEDIPYNYPENEEPEFEKVLRTPEIKDAELPASVTESINESELVIDGVKSKSLIELSNKLFSIAKEYFPQYEDELELTYYIDKPESIYIKAENNKYNEEILLCELNTNSGKVKILSD